MGRLPAFAVVLAAMASALVSGPASVGTDSQPAEPPSISSRSLAFSPNGDGAKDRARIRYYLPEASRVSVAVFGRDGKEFRVPLGSLSVGPHTWVWDGRVPGQRRVLPHGYYSVEVSNADGSDRAAVALDLRFNAQVEVHQRFGRRKAGTPRVFPRTTVVRDSIGFVTYPGEAKDYRRAILRVRDRDGRVVLRRNLVKRPTAFVDDDGFFQQRPVVWTARDSRGRALRPGLYAATIDGTDLAGNSGTGKPLLIRVSRQALEWVEESRSATPVDSRVGLCARSEANGCGDVSDCGSVVPSTRFAGGLSLRGAVCSEDFREPGAHTYHQVTVAEAVRGIDSYTIAFAGAPTYTGETDPVTLRAWSTTLTSSSAAQTPWLTEGPYLDGDRRLRDGIPPLLPSVWWEMSTSGDDAFDVGSFVVDVRYLAVAE